MCHVQKLDYNKCYYIYIYCIYILYIYMYIYIYYNNMYVNYIYIHVIYIYTYGPPWGCIYPLQGCPHDVASCVLTMAHVFYSGL